MYKILKLTKDILSKNWDSLIETYKNLSSIWDVSTEFLLWIFDKMQTNACHVYIALDEKNGIVGCGTLHISQKFQKNWSSCAHIEDIVVREWFERKWIGSAIIRSLMDELKNHNCYKVILDCEEKYVSFYEQFDFEVVQVNMKKYL